MIPAEIVIEPSEQLWPAVPVFLLAVLILDATVVRPKWSFFARRSRGRRCVIGLRLIAVLTTAIWLHPGIGSRAFWWYPAWTLVLFWTIAAREGPGLVGAANRRVLAGLIPIACAVCALVSLLILARSETPDSPALLAWSLVGLAAVTILWSVRSYREPSITQEGRHRLPLVLRILAVLLLALFLLNPISRQIEIRYDRACLLVLLDDSRSLGVRDVILKAGAEPTSRAGALNETLLAHQYEFDRIGRELDVLSYRFSDRLVAADHLSVRAEGDYTALGDAVQQAYESVLRGGRPVAGVLVFSDGVSNLTTVAEPSAAAAALAAGRVPLWTVGVGNETPTGQTRTIIPRSLLMARRVAAMNELPITAEFSFVGMQSEPVRVELLFDDDVVDRRRVRCTRIRQTRRIRFSFTPKLGGLHKVTVRARPERFVIDGPPPQLSQYLHVTDEVIRVLYLEGKPRYEGTFTVRALAADDQIRLQKALLARPGDKQFRTTPGGAAGRWQSYHVIILGDMAPGQFTPFHQEEILQHVGDSGCGLAIVGSRGFLGRGELNDAPMRELLPVGKTTGWMDRPATVVPTPAGLTHPVCRIDPTSKDILELWRTLPPMRGACRFERPKPAAQILAVDNTGAPMIVGHRYGAGRVLALAFDSTWQWCMLTDDGADYHRRFWRQVVLWLANRRPAVWIAADRPRYQLPLLTSDRQRVEIQAGVDSPVTGQAIDDLQLDARLVLPGGEAMPIDMTADADGETFNAVARPEAEGRYELELIARSRGKEIGRATGRFIVDSPDMEMLHPLVDFELLGEMAARTHPAGGKFVTLNGLSDVLNTIGTHDYRRRTEQTIIREFSVEGRWRILVLFCGLLIVEWIVRKRRGMV